ncbi:hypothetical protein HY090_03020 [Candidatus Kaiserbacteria bacterium]|nr:hypothetical protein [Candidatus Kaiserbacteria bacterium]
MAGGRDFLLFIFFLVALGVAWFLTGGPGHSISHEGWFLSPPSPLGNGQGYNVPNFSFDTTVNSNPSSGNIQQQEAPTPTQSVWNYFFNYRVGLGESPRPDASPYASMVRFSANAAKSSDPATEYVTIQTSSDLKTNLTITGWTLESGTTGIKTQIGNAAQIPFLGQVNIESPVSVGPTSTVIVTTGHSPNGTSFELNECTGYFSQFQKFTPNLRQECPKPEDELLRYPQNLAGNELCYNFVRNIRQCVLTWTEIPGNIGDACQNFILNTLSYNGCITAHKDDPDFYRREWRMFLNRDQELWRNTHDIIRLLDENGKLIGEASY